MKFPNMIRVTDEVLPEVRIALERAGFDLKEEHNLRYWQVRRIPSVILEQTNTTTEASSNG